MAQRPVSIPRNGTFSFDPLTERYLEITPVARRKNLGQYFTPPAVQEALFDLLPKRPYRRLLDPAAGTGEFLRGAARRFPSASLEGWEIDPELCEVARAVAPSATLVCRDALEDSPSAPRFDLVFGNPPYYEFKPDTFLRRRFASVISGRPNIFAFFFQVGLSALREGGVLAFVVPQSMNNGAYFSMLREYICTQGSVVNLSLLGDQDLFDAAQQTVMLIVIQKGARDDRFLFRRNGITIFSQDPARLNAAFAGRPTLADLGFSVKTGSIVWNQHKPHLSDDPSDGVPLLWAQNITREGLRFPLIEKRRQYLRTTGLTGMQPDRAPAILVNRVTGVGVRATLRCAVVPAGLTFFAENHVNVVYRADAGQGSLFNTIDYPEERFHEVARAIQSPEAIAAARLITGNTQISKTELERLLPLPL